MANNGTKAKDLMMIPMLLSSGFFGCGGGEYLSQRMEDFPDFHSANQKIEREEQEND